MSVRTSEALVNVMAIRFKSWLSSPSLLRTIISNLRLAARLLREPRVPAMLKWLPFLGMLYVLAPIDFIPDVLPVLGQLDDLGILLIAIEGFVRLCPTDMVAFHQAAIAQGRRYSPMVSPKTGDYIDAEWRRG